MKAVSGPCPTEPDTVPSLNGFKALLRRERGPIILRMIVGVAPEHLGRVRSEGRVERDEKRLVCIDALQLVHPVCDSDILGAVIVLLEEIPAQNGTLKASADDVSKFLAELGWREFSYHLLFHFPKLGSENFQSKFDAFPWASDTAHLKAWQRGRTGYPIVDAAMRQLWITGWMHNRMRMVAASFLIKHLLIDWREGEAWFWDTLLDADPASNTASWQWVAGSGADAAPYFRIFNPISQGQKFDAEGNYVREFVPELAKLPAKYIHNPWIAPKSVLDAAGVKLGKTYPHPIVDHDRARQRALAAFKSIGTVDA